MWRWRRRRNTDEEGEEEEEQDGERGGQLFPTRGRIGCFTVGQIEDGFAVSPPRLLLVSSCSFSRSQLFDLFYPPRAFCVALEK